MRQLDDTEGNAKLSEWREELAEGALERDFSVDNHIPAVEVRFNPYCNPHLNVIQILGRLLYSRSSKWSPRNHV